MSIYTEKISQATLPVIGLPDFVIFPFITANITIDNKNLLRIIREANKGKKEIVIATATEDTDVMSYDKLYHTATVAAIKQITPDKDSKGAFSVIVEGVSRATINEVIYLGRIPYARVEIKEVHEENEKKDEAAFRIIKKLMDNYEEFFKKTPKDFFDILSHIKDPGVYCDYVASYICYKTEDKIKILESFDLYERIEVLQGVFAEERIIYGFEKEIADRVQSRLVSIQKDNFLREQLKVIQSELGDDNDDELLEKLQNAKLPEEVKSKLQHEYSKIEKLSFGSPEAAIIRNYVETCLEIPWGVYTKDKLSVTKASAILERDHYGLKKVKERILEFISVKKLAPELNGQILCLVGPPGVGKTSIAKSIAEAIGRNYVRASLGGVRDEADIRGHRKTYVGSMPGRIINALKQSGSMNPLFLLDEVDKLTRDSHGDPSSALLEVLDGEQNNAFRDHFIEMPVDLSQCIFIATANTTETIPRPLLDRMEIIELPGYTMNEKLNIAKKHLIPKQMKRHGLKDTDFAIADVAIKELIDNYTRESGVRNLEREIAHLCRVVAKRIVTGEKDKQVVKKGELASYIGNQKIKPKKKHKNSRVGVVNGLAWTQVGGDMLEIEALTFPGTGKIEITGSLGDVMTESAKLAVSVCRANAKELGVKDPDFYKTRDV